MTKTIDIIRAEASTSATSSFSTAAGVFVPDQIANSGPAGRRVWPDFFAAQIRNPNTRQAYARAAHRQFDWLAEYGINDVVDIEPVHIAVWLEGLATVFSKAEKLKPL